MEITETHIEFAKRQLQKNLSIPAVAGQLSNRTPAEADFPDLIAIANRAKAELESEQENTNSPVKASDSTNPSDAESEDEAEEPLADQQDPVPAGTPNNDPPAVNNIAGESSSQGQDSWTQ